MICHVTKNTYEFITLFLGWNITREKHDLSKIASVFTPNILYHIYKGLSRHKSVPTLLYHLNANHFIMITSNKRCPHFMFYGNIKWITIVTIIYSFFEGIRGKWDFFLKKHVFYFFLFILHPVSFSLFVIYHHALINNWN